MRIFTIFYIFLFCAPPANAECLTAAGIRVAAETTGSVVTDVVPLNAEKDTVFLLFEDGSGVLITSIDGCVANADVIDDPVQVARLLAPLGPNL